VRAARSQFAALARFSSPPWKRNHTAMLWASLAAAASSCSETVLGSLFIKALYLAAASWA
jgi:hypothetical protein